MIGKRTVSNALWIIGCRIVQAFLNLVVTIVTARYLGPSNYGLISYAAAIVAFVAPVMRLGFNSTLVQEFIQYPDREGETLGTALVLNLISAVCCIFVVFSFVYATNGNDTTAVTVSVLYSISLIFQALEMTQYWFQSKLMAKYTSLTMLVAYIVISIYKIFLLVTGKDIYWFAVANSIDYALIAAALFVIYKKFHGQQLRFSLDRGRQMFAYSKYYILSNMMITVFAQTDRIMLQSMLGNDATGYYSVAVTCATMTNFVFSAVIDSFKPTILQRLKTDKSQFEEGMVGLYSIIIYASVIQNIVIFAFSGPIIRLMYGVEYMPSVSILKTLVWYTTFSYIGAVRTVWILAENKQNYLWKINMTGAVGNVILNRLLIPSMGGTGAALASLLTQFITNVVLGYVFVPIRPNNRLMIKGLNPLNIYREIKEYFHAEAHKM